jgi:hypothetical protein
VEGNFSSKVVEVDFAHGTNEPVDGVGNVGAGGRNDDDGGDDTAPVEGQGYLL